MIIHQNTLSGLTLDKIDLEKQFRDIITLDRGLHLYMDVKKDKFAKIKNPNFVPNIQLLFYDDQNPLPRILDDILTLHRSGHQDVYLNYLRRTSKHYGQAIYQLALYYQIALNHFYAKYNQRFSVKWLRPKDQDENHPREFVYLLDVDPTDNQQAHLPIKMTRKLYRYP